MTFAAIPTTYAGIRFRSRLEAKWAAFFDQLGWEWSYEPFDLNGWIPDFQIRIVGRAQPTLVEVKPAEAFPYEAAQKIHRADPTFKHDVLLVGLSPRPSGPDGGEFCDIGWHRTKYGTISVEGASPWSPCTLFHSGRRHIVTGHRDWHILAAPHFQSRQEVDPEDYQSPLLRDLKEEVWNPACNLTQWRAG